MPVQAAGTAPTRTFRPTPRRVLSFRWLCLALVFLPIHGVAWGRDMVPFVIPAQLDPARAIWVADYEPITCDAQRLRADRHFHQGDRVRIWGVNLSFGANFPTHQDAPHIATRLAAAGVNSVRCHHMDTSRWPRGIWNAQDGRTIEPEALDRLDYFIGELAQRGIWININLHVGRAHSQYLGLPETNSSYDKIAGIFTPALVDAQKQFARDLLDHVNPYRKVRYADDPAIAFVEITNEDSFFMWNGDETLRGLPEFYENILGGQFNQWLRRRYASDDALRAAWSDGTEPLGQNLLKNGGFSHRNSAGDVPAHWNLEQHEGCQASLSRPRDLPGDAIQIEITQTNETEWHLQLTQGGFALKRGRYYTVSFAGAGSRARTIRCSVGQAHSPWGNLGLSRKVDLGKEWAEFSFGFVATGNDDNARISFAFGGDDAPVYLARVQLRPGGQVALADRESLATRNIELYQENESQQRILDRMMFLAETEKAYFDEMKRFIKEDLGCDALVTGTIVFGPLGLYAQSDMDFIDAHAYWQHPRFPGRPWDQGNWTVEQKPMTDFPNEATLFRLAAERMAGKPFTVSEYNHPAPMDAQAECVPMMASFAAAQDWDGVWFYTYSHSGDSWDREHLSSFFDIDTNPGKWGFMRAGAGIFCEEGMAPLGPPRTVPFAESWDHLGDVALFHQQHDRDMLSILLDRAGGATRMDMLETALIPSFGDGLQTTVAPAGEIPEMTWNVDAEDRGFYQVVSPSAQVYIGHAERFAPASRGAVRITSPEFAALTVTQLGKDTQLLVTACGRCENTDMQFSGDRRTVGRNWGEAPVRIEPVEGTLALPEGRWECHALTPDGGLRRRVPIAYEGEQGTLVLSGDHETMWYYLRRQSR